MKFLLVLSLSMVLTHFAQASDQPANSNCVQVLLPDVSQTLERFSPYQIFFNQTSEQQTLAEPASRDFSSNSDLMFDFDSSSKDEKQHSFDPNEVQEAMQKGLAELQTNLQKNLDDVQSKMPLPNLIEDSQTVANENVMLEVSDDLAVEYGSVQFVSMNPVSVGMHAKLEFDLLKGGRVLSNLHYKFYFKAETAEEGERVESEQKALKQYCFQK